MLGIVGPQTEAISARPLGPRKDGKAAEFARDTHSGPQDLSADRGRQALGVTVYLRESRQGLALVATAMKHGGDNRGGHGKSDATAGSPNYRPQDFLPDLLQCPRLQLFLCSIAYELLPFDRFSARTQDSRELDSAGTWSPTSGESAERYSGLPFSEPR